MPPECGAYFSRCPIRYSTGEIGYEAKDLTADGFGIPWGHTRTFSNRHSLIASNGNGCNWLVQQWPYVRVEQNGDVGVLAGTFGSTWFSKSAGGGYAGDFGTRRSLSYDSVEDIYTFHEIDGTTTTFDGHSGLFRKRTAPGGESIEVTKIAPSGIWFEDVERQYTAGGETTTEQFHYEYDDSAGTPLLTTLTLRRKVDNGAWQNVQRVAYEYYTSGDTSGDYRDLKTVETATWTGGEWESTGTSYYRYYRCVGALTRAS